MRTEPKPSLALRAGKAQVDCIRQTVHLFYNLDTAVRYMRILEAGIAVLRAEVEEDRILKGKEQKEAKLKPATETHSRRFRHEQTNRHKPMG